MKLKQILTIAALLVTSAAQAGDWYGSVSYDQKDKQNSTSNEFHNVVAMTIGNKLGSGFSIEALVEEELVKNTGKADYADEGLYQIRLNKAFETGTLFTPYVGEIGRAHV